ncbi:MAG: hypothetical protein K2X11_15345 [Acetobacteraceae bacterium]|nr:hypothetical protein [Acetobacteraceae bacterium]
MDTQARSSLRSAFALALRSALEGRRNAACQLEEIGYGIRAALEDGRHGPPAEVVADMRHRAVLAAELEAAMNELRRELDQV